MNCVIPIGVVGNTVLSNVNGCSTVVNTSILNKFSSNVAFWQ